MIFKFILSSSACKSCQIFIGNGRTEQPWEDSMRNLTINNPNKIIKDIQNYFDELPDGDFLHRLHAIFLIALGWKCPTVACYYKKSARTIHNVYFDSLY
jgi:hypothetical protein